MLKHCEGFMMNYYRHKFLLLEIVVWIFFAGSCTKIDNPIHKKHYIAYNIAEPISASICLWKDDKRAAYTIAFDDVRASHYLISAPELAKRRFRGTFNLNTANVSDWNQWKLVARLGHELASHTVHHVKLTELSDDSIRWELQKSKQMIETMVPENGPVLSFTNPYGIGDARVKSLVKQYYLSERDNWGLNDSSLTPEQLYDVKGVGIYPPFNEKKLKNRLEQALKMRAWILVYFHTVTEHPDSTDICQCPLNFFLDHLDFMETKRDSFWIATQREVAEYVIARTRAVIDLKKTAATKIEICVKNVVKANLSDLIVSVRVKIPAEWVGQSLQICDASGKEFVLNHLSKQVVLQLKLNKKYTLMGFHL